MAKVPNPFPKDPPAPQGPAASPRFSDAHHDRLLLLPTAETNPQGSWAFTDYDIVILQVTFAPSDRTQVSVSGVPPLGDERVAALDFTVKTVVVREPRVSFALMGSASGIFGAPEANGFVGRAGGVVTLCEPAWKCRLGVSFATNVALLGPASVAFTGVGASFRARGIVSLIAEIDTAVPLGPEIGQVNGILGGGGVRLSKPKWGLDLAFFAGGKAKEPVVALPWLVFTYRVL